MVPYVLECVTGVECELREVTEDDKDFLDGVMLMAITDCEDPDEGRPTAYTKTRKFSVTRHVTKITGLQDANGEDITDGKALFAARERVKHSRKIVTELYLKVNKMTNFAEGEIKNLNGQSASSSPTAEKAETAEIAKKEDSKKPATATG